MIEYDEYRLLDTQVIVYGRAYVIKIMNQIGFENWGLSITSVIDGGCAYSFTGTLEEAKEAAERFIKEKRETK